MPLPSDDGGADGHGGVLIYIVEVEVVEPFLSRAWLFCGYGVAAENGFCLRAWCFVIGMSWLLTALVDTYFTLAVTFFVAWCLPGVICV